MQVNVQKEHEWLKRLIGEDLRVRGHHGTRPAAHEDGRLGGRPLARRRLGALRARGVSRGGRP